MGIVVAAALLATVGVMTTPAGATSTAGTTHGSLPTNPGTHLRPGVTPKVAGGTRFHAASGGPQLTYYGGPVVSNMKSVDVIYGSGSFAPYIGNYVAQFTRQYLGSGVIDWLHEYDTPASGGTGQTIGRGTYAGQYTITPAPSDTGVKIQDSQIQSELAAQISAGHLPTPDADTSYAIFFPHGEQICMSGSCSGVAGGFCAYHSTLVVNGVTTTYQVMPDNQAGSGLDTGCGAGTLQQNETSTLSHELVETITDPYVGLATTFGPPLGWYDATNGEIGDICNARHGTFTGSNAVQYTSQLQWSNAAHACILAPNAGPVITSPSSTVASSGTALQFTVTTTGFPIPIVTESGALPPGVAFSGGALSGTPTQSGTFPITFTAHNGVGTDATQSFTLTVGGATPASATIANLPSVAYLGNAFTPSVSTNGDGATSVTTSTPSVCTVASGVVSDVAVGSCTLVAHVSAGSAFAAGDGAPQTYQVLGFTITTTTLPAATRGTGYGPVPLTEDGAAPSTSPYVTTVKWTRVTLPRGVRLSPRGVLSGVPSRTLVAGPNPVTVKVTETVTTLNGTRKVKTKTSVQATIGLNVS